MKKILIAGDLHLSNTRQFSRIVNKENIWITIGLNSLKQLIDYSRKEGNIPIIILGDIFDLKDKVPTKVLNAFYDLMNNITMDIYILVGNHDYIDKNEPTFKVLNNFKNVNIILESKTSYSAKGTTNISDETWTFIPYKRKDEDVIELLNEIAPKLSDDKQNILFLHQDLHNSKYLSYTSKSKLTKEITKKWDWIFSGHIHSFQEVWKNAYHPGTLHQLEFNGNTNNGFIEFDGKEIILHEIDAPKFIILEDTDFKEEVIRNNFVKVKLVLTKAEQMEFNVKETKKKLLEMGANGVTFDIKLVQEFERRIITDNTKDYTTLLKEYVNYKLPGEDVSTILEVGKTLLEEVK